MVADNKLATKRLLVRNGIPTTILIQKFSERKDITRFHWDLPKEGFVVKPARGFGGEGILVFKSWKNDFGETSEGEEYDIQRLSSHLLDILDGVYSLQYLPDSAYIEEKVIPHPFFKKLTSGLADVRIIVFNKVPVMAMLRLPTLESQGRANLHFGAIGAGIDLRTGITKHAILNNKTVSKIPGTKIKTRGIRIPDWDKVLTLAVKAQVVSKLGFAGVDIVFDANKGPLILELNSRPGLAIQNANLVSLRSRLERVENIEIPSALRGIALSKSLFAEDALEKVKTEPTMLSTVEPVTIESSGVSRSFEAKIDSGAYRTSVDSSVAQMLDLPRLKRNIHIESASGQQLRKAVKITFVLAGKRVRTVASIADRSQLKYPMIIGRKDLKGFLIDPSVGIEDDDEEKES